MVVAFLNSYEISGVIFIVVVRGVAVWDGITKAVKKIKSGILVVSVIKRVYTVNNARQDRERGEGTLFDAAFCKEVEEPIGTLEVSCWSEAYSEFCAGLRGVLWEGFPV